MITVPVWLFAALCAAVAVLALLAVRALLSASRRVDRILAEETTLPPPLPPVGSDVDRDGAPVRWPVDVSSTEHAPRRGRP